MLPERRKRINMGNFPKLPDILKPILESKQETFFTVKKSGLTARQGTVSLPFKKRSKLQSKSLMAAA